MFTCGLCSFESSIAVTKTENPPQAMSHCDLLGQIIAKFQTPSVWTLRCRHLPQPLNHWKARLVRKQHMAFNLLHENLYGSYCEISWTEWKDSCERENRDISYIRCWKSRFWTTNSSTLSEKNYSNLSVCALPKENEKSFNVALRNPYSLYML